MSVVPDYVEKLNLIFSSLPGIGNKTANRLTFYVLNKKEGEIDEIIKTLVEVRDNTNFCQNCTFFAKKNSEYCEICANSKRNKSQILVVENRIDVIALEELNFFKGKYHILNGLISPLKNILPESLNIQTLKKRLVELSKQKVEEIEVILAIDTNIEGEATASYMISYIEGLKLKNVKISTLARGLPTGADLEYTDKDTLQNSFINRDNLN
ncbi:recombination protein RecR [Candidatus Dojkabacteria bacterium]|nr:recombination protein RecR [Candidatus Dojkabacteria bacterium]